MPKVLEYIVQGACWIFLFWDTDINENRAHVHVGKKVGKKATVHLCKIWLEPEVEVAVQGELTALQVKEVIILTHKYRDRLLSQWDLFKNGKSIRIIKIRKK